MKQFPGVSISQWNAAVKETARAAPDKEAKEKEKERSSSSKIKKVASSLSKRKRAARSRSRKTSQPVSEPESAAKAGKLGTEPSRQVEGGRQQGLRLHPESSTVTL